MLRWRGCVPERRAAAWLLWCGGGGLKRTDQSQYNHATKPYQTPFQPPRRTAPLHLPPVRSAPLRPDPIRVGTAVHLRSTALASGLGVHGSHRAATHSQRLKTCCVGSTCSAYHGSTPLPLTQPPPSPGWAAVAVGSRSRLGSASRSIVLVRATLPTPPHPPCCPAPRACCCAAVLRPPRPEVTGSGELRQVVHLIHAAELPPPYKF